MWYLARLVETTTIEGQNRSLCSLTDHLIDAHDIDDAVAKIEAFIQETTYVTTNIDDETVYNTYAGIHDVRYIGEYLDVETLLLRYPIEGVMTIDDAVEFMEAHQLGARNIDHSEIGQYRHRSLDAAMARLLHAIEDAINPPPDDELSYDDTPDNDWFDEVMEPAPYWFTASLLIQHSDGYYDEIYLLQADIDDRNVWRTVTDTFMMHLEREGKLIVDVLGIFDILTPFHTEEILYHDIGLLTDDEIMMYVHPRSAWSINQL